MLRPPRLLLVWVASVWLLETAPLTGGAVVGARLPATAPAQRLHAAAKRMQHSNSLSSDYGEESPGSPASEDWVQVTGLPDQTNARVGSGLELECEAFGSPPPALLWLRDGLPLHEEAESNAVPEWGDSPASSSPGGGLAKVVSRLQLPCVTREEQGAVYSCLAAAGSRSDLARTRLHLLADNDVASELGCSAASSSVAPPRVLVHSPSVLQVMGEDALLPCQVSPGSTTRWLGPSGHAPRGSRFRVLPSGSLLVSRITWADMGDYTCVAETSAGRDSETTFLYPLLNEDV